MVETNGEGLPPAFVDALRRALAHYGVRTLDGSPNLKETLLWICKSHQRMEQQAASVLDILEQRLRLVKASEPRPNGSFRMLLDRMISIARELYPSVSDLAREVRYRYFDQPLFEQREKQSVRGSGKPSRISCGISRRRRPPRQNPCADRLSATSGWTVRRPVSRCRSQPAPSRCSRCSPRGTTRFGPSRIRMHLRWTDIVTSPLNMTMRASAFTFSLPTRNITALSTVANALLPVIAEVPADHDVVLDFHVCSNGKLSTADTTQAEVQAMLNQVAFPRSIRRIVVAVADASQGQRVSGMQHFTYRPSRRMDTRRRSFTAECIR